jgi:hypothetical protein
MAAWTTSTDGDKRINLGFVQGLEVQQLTGVFGSTTPDAPTSSWGYFAILTDGQRVQMGAASYATKAAAITAMVTAGT